MAYQTLLTVLGIHHVNTGIKITPDLLMKGSFMLVFDLTHDGCTSERHTSFLENGSIRIQLKFFGAIAEAVTTLLKQEFGASIQIDRQRNATTE